MPVLRQGDLVGSERGEGRWVVERKIGEGQFSEVYQVVDVNTQQQVSIGSGTGGGRAGGPSRWAASAVKP